MSICINNDLIWISIPKCASISIENAITNSNLKYKHILNVDKSLKPFVNRHVHVRINDLRDFFGNLETISINRYYVDRWMSCFSYIWDIIDYCDLTPKYKFTEIDNDFIYKTYTDEYLNNLIKNDENSLMNLMRPFILESNIKFDIRFSGVGLIKSQNYWKNNEKSTYEFDITEINKMEKFISERYDIEFKIPYLNKSINRESKIIIDNELKNFIWNKFESIYVKNKNII